MKKLVKLDLSNQLATYELFILIIKNYFRTFRYVFFGYFQPIFLLAIFFFLFTKVMHRRPIDVIPGYLLLAPISASFIAFGNMISSWKRSVLLTRIDITPIRKSQLMATFLLVFSFLAILSSLWMLLWATLFLEIGFGHLKVTQVFAQVNFGYYFLALIQIVFISITLSMVISGASNSLAKQEVITMLIFFLGAFLGGIIFPNQMVDQYTALKYISFIFPFKYSSYISDYAWNQSATLPLWCSIVVGFSIGVMAFLVSLKVFHWSNEK